MGLAEAQAKWERKMQNAGAKYTAAEATMPANWAAGLAAFGTPPGPLTSAAYAAGIAGAGARLQAGVAGKGEKWARRFREGMSR